MSAPNLVPVGLCSRKRAEYLMMAAAAAGGAIYVACPEVPGVTTDQHGFPSGYLCVGRLPNGEAVPTKLLDGNAVVTFVEAERDRLKAAGQRLKSDVFDEWVTELDHIAHDLRSKIGGAS